MIATNEAVHVLRNGWHDAASTLAADVPEVAELLQARLEMAIATQRLDERHLLETIQEVESLTSRAGSPSSQPLARRLRRTVYEYLLALDAARPSEVARASLGRPASASGSPLVGAEEVAALGHVSRSRSDDSPDAQPEATAPAEMSDTVEGTEFDDTGEETSPVSATASRRRFALRHRQRRGPDALDSGDTADADVDEDPADQSGVSAAPGWRFTPAGEAALFQGGLEDTPSTVVPADQPAAPPAGGHEAHAEVPPAARQVGDEPPLESLSADAAAVEADIPVEAGPARHGFVAPRAGFHIVEDAPARRSADRDQSRLEMPVFSADEPADEPAQAPAAETGTDAADFVAWAGSTAPAEPGSAAAPAEPISTHPAPAAPPSPAPTEPPSVARFDAAAEPDGAPQGGDAGDTLEPPPPVGSAEPDDVDAEQRGWGVRRHGEARSARGAPAVAARPIEDDPFENNTKLSDLRRRIEDRLRKKRCDEAAALLQELAQETGGRAVAELAMNAGDRCRALGKSNAALNCYLAAARSDPVYELPLSRLADICIDNQDTELAVSYLERIARLYRFRGEDKAALRVYRRIATIAPYREDVLTLLMNAQRTGQLEWQPPLSS